MKNKLLTLLKCLPNYQFMGKDVLISGITQDSRKVKKGDMFVAIKGLNCDGHDYIQKAIDSGAACVVGEKLPDKSWSSLTAYVKVADSREALGLLASQWFDNPSEKMKVIGVTGTDGKTTTVNMIYEILKSSGENVGMISTISAKIGNEAIDTGLHVTNPDSIDLQKLLSRMVANGCTYAVIEVTSHGLDQGRVIGVDFDVSVLTNITHEHLDYHKTFENYLNAKAMLFEAGNTIVLNKDDSAYNFLSQRRENKSQIISYSIIDKSADVYASNITHTKNIPTFEVKTKASKFKVKLSMAGSYNISNALAAISVAKHYTISDKVINTALSSFPQLEGRREEINNDLHLKIYVDFAHTPNSLENVLRQLKSESQGRVICVFGCASQRDLTKRPMMAEVATRLADIAVFTAEDPRKEDVFSIFKDMLSGVGSDTVNATDLSVEDINKLEKHAYLTMPERGEAIYYAIKKLAKKGDTVVICGKGHEMSMAYDNVEHPWNDREFVKDILTNKLLLDAVILAAGKGSRLKSQTPKVMHKLAGKPMLTYPIDNLRRIGVVDIIAVVGYRLDVIHTYFGNSLRYVEQDRQLGTGHAAFCGVGESKNRNVLVMYGDDNAFYTKETYRKLIKMHSDSKATITLISLVLDNPFGFGRIVRDEKDNFVKIVEEKDATDEEKKISEVNDGVYLFDRAWFMENFGKIKNNNVQQEYLLTDFIELAIKQSRKVLVYAIKDSSQWCGINTPDQLTKADNLMRHKLSQI
ncbi:UDP-N-acetylmuramoyl-L-alanyl-D-glutamate--2,6-diaminopimelate ligase [Candidatus Woesebacteria bacterium]|nr:MAG: UDP-N-acetylmuramoyl-L-alanyl-D-glutamate--2,6-diaminopimelate ligase [Candidatus Woesebacteria bacterium]